MTFEKWVKEQKGQMKYLTEECGGRIVLFDNFTKDKQEKNDQIDKLIEVVDSLSAGGRRYTDKNFEEARETRDKILEEAKENIITENTLMEINLIFQKLEKIRNGDHQKNPNKKLEKLKKRCQEAIKEIKPRENTNSTIIDFLESITSLNRIIDLEIQFNEKIDKERIENTKYKENLQKRHEDEIEQIYIEFSKNLTKQNQEEEKKKAKETKQHFKKEIEELKKKMQHGHKYSKESVRKIIEQMEFNKQLGGAQNQTITTDIRTETNEQSCSRREEMAPKIQHEYSRGLVKEKIEHLGLNKQRSDLRILTITKEQRTETNEQVCPQQEEVARKIKLPTESTSRGMFNKENSIRSKLADILSRQAQEEKERKMAEERLKKGEIDERQKLITETRKAEDKYRDAEDRNNDSFFSKFKNGIKSIFKK